MPSRISDPAAPSPRDLACVLLAGGLGTRIRHLHPTLPKPLVPVAGRPFIEWVLLALRAQGIRSVRLSVGHLASAIEERLGSGDALGVAIEYRREESPLGTGGALLHATSDLRDVPVVVLNADSLVVFELDALIRQHVARAAAATLVAVEVPSVARFGALELAPDGRVVRLLEKGRDGPGSINAGVYLFAAGALDALGTCRPCSIEKDLFPPLIAARSVFASPTRGDFTDMGTPEGLDDASRVVARNRHRFEGTP